MRVFLQGDLGPFNPGLPVQVPLWLAVNLKQRQKCRLLPPEWMDVGEDAERAPRVVGRRGAVLGGVCTNCSSGFHCNIISTRFI